MDKIPYHGFTLTRILSPPGALIDSACLHTRSSLGRGSGSWSPWSILWPGLAALQRAVVVNEKVDVIHCGLEERDGWQSVLRLSLVDTDLGWSSRREPTKVDGVWDRMRSQPVHLSLSPSLPALPCPGTGDWGLSMEGHVDKVECCSAVEIGHCCNYCRVNGKAFKYLQLSDEGEVGTPPTKLLPYCVVKTKISTGHLILFHFFWEDVNMP